MAARPYRACSCPLIVRTHVQRRRSDGPWAAAEFRGAVRALLPAPPAAGTGVAGYQVATTLTSTAALPENATALWTTATVACGCWYSA